MKTEQLSTELLMGKETNKKIKYILEINENKRTTNPNLWKTSGAKRKVHSHKSLHKEIKKMLIRVIKRASERSVTKRRDT